MIPTLFLTISKENIFFKIQCTRLRTIVANKKGSRNDPVYCTIKYLNLKLLENKIFLFVYERSINSKHINKILFHIFINSNFFWKQHHTSSLLNKLRVCMKQFIAIKLKLLTWMLSHTRTKVLKPLRRRAFFSKVVHFRSKISFKINFTIMHSSISLYSLICLVFTLLSPSALKVEVNILFY